MKHFGMAYAMKKKHGAHMCHGGECDHPSHFAEGGDIKGVHTRKNNSVEGMDAGTLIKTFPNENKHERSQEWHKEAVGKAKDEHKRVLGEMKSMKKPNLYAEGGSVMDDTHRWENEKGINKVASGDKPGRSEAGASLHPAFSIGEDIDKEVAKRRHHKTLAEMRSMPKPKLMAEGGMIEDGYNEEDEPIDPMIHKIMMGRMKGYSEGGQVANEESGESSDEPTMAKWDGNEFDDLALRDDLEFDATGENSGDHEGDEQEDHDKADIIARVMSSRRKKDRMPRPA